MTTTSRKTTTMDSKAMLLMIAVAALLAAGCLSLDIDNEPPTADVQISVDGVAYASGQEVPYAGTPLTVTLDGRGSSDEDGVVEQYIWLRTNATAEERMMANTAAPGEAPVVPADPPRGMVTQVLLGEGTHQYSLWVVDNEGKTSVPETVVLNIATPSIYMPDAMCSAEYMHPLGESCAECVCTPTDMMGCLSDYQRCFQNADAQFTELCTALVDCALATDCSASGTCYMEATCMAEVDAAGGYMGGNIGFCQMPAMADANPCSAATVLGTCTAMSCGTVCTQ